MNTGTKIALAASGGYVLGRTKKMKLAVAMALFLAGRKLPKSPLEMIQQGAGALSKNPQVAGLTDQVKGSLMDAGKAAASRSAERWLAGLSERLREGIPSQDSGSQGSESQDESQDSESQDESQDTESRDSESQGESQGESQDESQDSEAQDAAQGDQDGSQEGDQGSEGGTDSGSDQTQNSGTGSRPRPPRSSGSPRPAKKSSSKPAKGA